MPLTRSELAELARAKHLLETPGIAMRLSSYAGAPVEKGLSMLPARVQKAVHDATQKALMTALSIAVKSLGRPGSSASRDRLHRVAVATSGAIGGAFGLAALAVELPVSTGLILRSIADIAASEGEDPKALDTQLACLTVFALGSPKDRRDDAAESGYFAARTALAGAISEATKHIAQKGFTKGGGPAVVRLISLITARFGIVVSEKTAAQLVPVIGAAGGALINTIFIGHYQDMARGHFIVRRLEKAHDALTVREAYDKL